jgi:hypothetical protein
MRREIGTAKGASSGAASSVVFFDQRSRRSHPKVLPNAKLAGEAGSTSSFRVSVCGPTYYCGVVSHPRTEVAHLDRDGALENTTVVG